MTSRSCRQRVRCPLPLVSVLIPPEFSLLLISPLLDLLWLWAGVEVMQVTQLPNELMLVSCDLIHQVVHMGVRVLRTLPAAFDPPATRC